MAITPLGGIRFGSLVSGKRLLRWKEDLILDLSFYSIIPLPHDHVMLIGDEARRNAIRSKAIVMKLKTVPRNVCISASSTLHVVSVSTSPGGIIRNISAHKCRFSAYAPKRTTQTWAWESGTFQTIAVLRSGPYGSISNISSFQKCILYTNSAKDKIHVYSATAMDFVKTIKIPMLTNRYLPTGCEDVFVAFSTGKKHAMVLDITSEMNHMDVSLQDGVQLIIATDSDEIWQYPMPSDVAVQLRKSISGNSASAVEPPPRADVCNMPSEQGRAKKIKIQEGDGSVIAVDANMPVPKVTPEARTTDGVLSKKSNELKTMELTATAIEKMEVIEIATLWVAFVGRYSDSGLGKFITFRDRIFRVMEANDFDGSVLVDRKVMPLGDLVDVVLSGIRKDEKEELTVGSIAKMKQFLIS